METDRVKLNLLLIAIIFIILSEIASQWLFPDTGMSDITGTGVLRVIQIIGVLWLVFITDKGFSPIGMARAQIFPGIIRGLLWSAGFGLITLAGFCVLALVGINPIKFFHIGFLNGSNSYVSYFLVGGMIGPIAEEIVFRGLIYGFFRKWGMLSGVLISTIIFVGVHGQSAGLPVTQFAGGLVFAVSYELEQKLMVPILIHILGNMAIFALAVINIRLT
ncbi:MAG: CPBP family intramembrane metalloprotease [Proteobacteria bacterium]|nr:CPBP family intramembrane metalloprotease [Pseudomonadota bacterium]